MLLLLDNGPCHRTMVRVREREANLLSTYFQHNGSTAGKSLALVARAQVSMTVLLPAVGHLDEYIFLFSFSFFLMELNVLWLLSTKGLGSSSTSFVF